jgi:hypothetical protein
MQQNWIFLGSVSKIDLVTPFFPGGILATRRLALILSWLVVAGVGLHLGPTHAQDADDTYDPFADYSEFEESADEEADINFFRNGRFFTLGFTGGYRGFTETMGDIQDGSTAFGGFVSYFFDLRFALQFGFSTSDHRLHFTSPSGKSVTGNVAITNLGLDLKYYLNTQNVTRGLAKLNPYLIGGFSQVYRTTTVAGQPSFGKENSMGFDLGAGIEVPMFRDVYCGVQAMFQLVNFPDESSEMVLGKDTATPEPTGKYNKGDIVNLSVILGVNF